MSIFGSNEPSEAELLDDEAEAKRENDARAQHITETLALWRTREGLHARSLDHAKALVDIIEVGGMTHQRLLDAVTIRIAEAVNEALTGDSESFTYGPPF